MIGSGVKKAGTYVLAYSDDPALDLPEEKEASMRAFDVARETQDWVSVTKPGMRLSLFTMRRLDAEKYLQWSEKKDSDGQARFGQVSWFIKLAKLCLVKVDHLDETERKVRRLRDQDFGDCADETVFAGVDPDLVRTILTDLGVSAWRMESTTPPK